MAEAYVKTGKDLYKTVITTGNHQMIADEPIPLGEDLGPNPYEFLLSAIGACVGITLRMYADRKQWDLKEVEVFLSEQRIHAKDCEDCRSDSGFVHIIKKRLKFTGNLTQEQIDRLVEISNRCPVQKTVMNEVKFETTLMDYDAVEN